MFVDWKGQITIISKFLLSINNTIFFQLKKLIELPKSSDQNVLESFYQFFFFVVWSKASKALNQRRELSCKKIHSLSKIISTFWSADLFHAFVYLENLFNRFNERHGLITYPEFVFHRRFWVINIVVLNKLFHFFKCIFQFEVVRHRFSFIFPYF